MKIVISVVSHGQHKLVQRLLDSLDIFLKNQENEVLIVITENAPVEEKYFSKKLKLHKIFNLRSKGFGANHNAVFEKFDSDLFLIVNPDTILVDFFDLDLIHSLVQENEIDLCSPVIKSPRGGVEDYKRADLTFFNLLKRKIFKNHAEKFDWFSGIFLIVRSESFRKLKGFDTDFFMYVEDCDLSMRARKAGMKVDDIEEFSIVHDARRATRTNVKHLKWHVVSLLRYWFLK